jgi:hypothetical protein
MKTYKSITVPAKATLLNPTSERYKAVAADIKSKYGFEPSPQMDLMYVESCLVTAGFNQNDDHFSNEELWKARATPVLKPANWQHKDKDILGVVYSVQARTLDGTVIPFDQEEVPTEPFELFTEAVVFKLIHPERAQEISDRAAKGNLHVSMEAWFDDYDYVLDSEKGEASKVIARNAETSFLDENLRAKGGSGKYENRRIGRGLRSITFGGYGFVDIPANKRSDITSVADMVCADGRDDRLLDELRKFMSRLEKLQPISAVKEREMTVANDNSQGLDIKALVADAIREHDDAKTKAAAAQALNTRATELEASNTSLVEQNVALKNDVEARDAQVKTLTDSITEFNAVVDEFVQSVAGEAPTGDLKAKIAVAGTALAALKVRADRATQLEEELAVAALQIREEEVRGLYNNLVTEEEVGHLVTIATGLNDAEYSLWLRQHQWMSAKLAGKPAAAAADPAKEEKPADKEDPKYKGKKPPFPPKGTDASAAVDALLQAGGGIAFHQSESLGVSSGVNSGELKTPKHKIAGSDSATSDPAAALATAKVEDGVNFAGAGEERAEADKPMTAMRALASELFPSRDAEEGEDK